MLKRLLFIFLTLTLCLAALPPLTASAEVMKGDEIVGFQFDEGFALNKSTSSSSVAAANGFVMLDTGTGKQNFKISQNALYANKVDDVFFDLQLYHVPGLAKYLQQSVNLSFRLNPLSASSVCHNLVSFKDNLATAYDPGYLSFAGGTLSFSGEAIGTMKVNSYNQIDMQFHYNKDTALFDMLYIYLNGALIKTHEIQVPIATLNHFRMCRHSGGIEKNYMIDDLVITSVDDVVVDTDTDLDNLIASIPDSEKKTTVVLSSFDFNNIVAVNTNQNDINSHGGFLALGGIDATVQNQALLINAGGSDPFVDLRFYSLAQFPRVDEDFVLSMKIKPLSDDCSIGHLIDFRYNNGDWIQNTNSISNCKIKVDGLAVGALPVNKYSLLEFVFHYSSTAKSTYESYDVLLNGEQIATYRFTTEAVSINDFRIFRYLTGSFMVDDISLAYGTNSLLYQGEKIHWLDEKMSNVEINPQMPASPLEPPISSEDEDDKPSSGNNNQSTENQNPSQDTTQAPQTDPSTTEPATSVYPFQFGCGAVASFTLPTLLMLGALAILPFLKTEKKGGRS